MKRSATHNESNAKRQKVGEANFSGANGNMASNHLYVLEFSPTGRLVRTTPSVSNYNSSSSMNPSHLVCTCDKSAASYAQTIQSGAWPDREKLVIKIKNPEVQAVGRGKIVDIAQFGQSTVHHADPFAQSSFQYNASLARTTGNGVVKSKIIGYPEVPLQQLRSGQGVANKSNELKVLAERSDIPPIASYLSQIR